MAESTDNIIQEIVKLWRLDRVLESGGLYNGATEEELDAFESLHEIRLPLSFRKLYATVNGMKICEWDSCMFHLMSLNEITEEHGVKKEVDGSGRVMIEFGDGIIRSQIYTLLYDENNELGVFIDQALRYPMANNFESFLEKLAYGPWDDLALFNRGDS